RLPTGKPDAGDPPVRFGREGERLALLLSSSIASRVVRSSGKRYVRMLCFLMAKNAPAHFNFARDLVERWAKERPDSLALWCVNEGGRQEQKLTFRQLAENLRRAAGFFQQLGLKRGDRVLLVTPRVPEWWIATLGWIRLGVVPIPGTPLLTARDIKYRLETSEAVALITDQEGADKAAGLALGHRLCIDGECPGWTR